MAEGNAAGWPRAASPSPVAPTGRPGKTRTAKRFAYRNAAISQATYLGITKLVLITCAEFADDNGVFWHSIRSLARACGLSVGATHKSVQELLQSGVLKLLRHGGPKTGSNKYQFVLTAIPEHPTVYEVSRENIHHTNVHQANLGEERSFGERSVREVNGNPIQCSPGEPMHGSAFTRRTEDRELNLEDSKLNRLKTGTGRSFAHVRERPDPAEFGAEEPETLPEADEPHSDDADQHEPDQRDKLNQEAFVRDGEVMTGPILAEIYRQCYRQVIGVSCPWDSGDEEAAARTVARLPADWRPEEYRRCMEGLFQSKDGRCQKKPSLALRHLQEYIQGPLNKYGGPLTDKDLTNKERFAKVMDELDELKESRSSDWPDSGE